MPASRPSAVTIGAYDGVHTGHRQLIEHVRRLASDDGLRSIVVTFDRHPASVVRPESAPKLLTDLEQKLELLSSTGVDEVAVVHFDEERSTEPAEDFVDEVLVGWLSSRVVVVGRDFHFGKGRGGNVALLEAMGATLGFRVVPFGLVADRDDELVSSTRIRDLIASGHLAHAAELLGRPHEVRGTVLDVSGGEAVEGGSSGDRADLGELTLVEVPDEILLPPPGPYEVRAGSSAVGRGDRLDRAALVVPGPGGELVLSGLARVPGPGERLRILFDDPLHS